MILDLRGFAAILCETQTTEQMKTIVRQMADQRIGYCFVTDQNEPNPWGKLPAYWDAEVQEVLSLNSK